MILKPRKRSKSNKISEIDKYIKKLILKQTFQIVKGKIPDDCILEKVYPSDPEEHKALSIYDNIRIIFEHLCGYKRPDYLKQSEFQNLSKLGAMASEPLTESEYTAIFKSYSKVGTKYLMDLPNFGKALEHIADQVCPGSYTDYQKLSDIVDKIMQDEKLMGLF